MEIVESSVPNNGTDIPYYGTCIPNNGTDVPYYGTEISVRLIAIFIPMKDIVYISRYSKLFIYNVGLLIFDYQLYLLNSLLRINLPYFQSQCPHCSLK